MKTGIKLSIASDDQAFVDCIKLLISRLAKHLSENNEPSYSKASTDFRGSANWMINASNWIKETEFVGAMISGT